MLAPVTFGPDKRPASGMVNVPSGRFILTTLIFYTHENDA